MLARRFSNMHRSAPIRYALDPAHEQLINQYMRFALRSNGMRPGPGGLQLYGQTGQPWQKDPVHPQIAATLGAFAGSGQQVDLMALLDQLTDSGYHDTPNGVNRQVGLLHQMMQQFSQPPNPLHSLAQIGGDARHEYEHGWEYRDHPGALPYQPREFIPHIINSMGGYAHNHPYAQQIGDYDSDIMRGHLHKLPDLMDTANHVMDDPETPWYKAVMTGVGQRDDDPAQDADNLQHHLGRFLNRRVLPRMLGQQPQR
jgi:hypothetical protein